MKVLKCGSQTNLLPPQVEQERSLMQIRLAVVLGGGGAGRMLLVCFCFQNGNLFCGKLSIHFWCLPKDFSHPTPLCQKKSQTTETPSTAHTHTPPYAYTRALTCSKAVFPQTFPLKEGANSPFV